MANNSQSYWAERARKDKIKVIKTGEKGIDNLKRLLKLNLDDVERQIKEFYDKYGDNPAEKMTYAEWEKYKAKLSKLAKENPQDKYLQLLAKQNIPKYRIDRLRALQLDLQMQLTEATNGQAKGIYNTLDDVSKVSQATFASRMDKTLGLTFNAISSSKMKQIIMSDWSGANWSERIWKDRAKVGQKLNAILEKGITQGTSLQKMSRELRDLTGESFNNAFRLIRTETSHIDGQVTLEGYRQASEELGLEYYEYDAFLDSRTSTICRDLDKKRFKVSEAEVGVNYPPMHPNCRSTTQLVLDEEAADLGDNAIGSVYDDSKEKIKPNKYDPEVLVGAKRGLPMTREKANNQNANPKFGISEEYGVNCQSCVVAFEARLRGFNVYAKPNYRQAGSIQMKLAKTQSLAWESNILGLHPKPKISKKQGRELYQWLQKNVKEGQRFTFSSQFINKYGRTQGHIVCLDKNKKGQLRYYDPQNGVSYVGGELRRKLQRTNTIKSKLLRVDNCTFNMAIMDEILQKV